MTHIEQRRWYNKAIMYRTTGGRGSLGVMVLAFAAVACHNVHAVICHPNHEPPAEWTARPDANVVGAWTYSGSTYNASFVVISPNWIITTRHQLTDATQVTINGTNYDCFYDTAWIGGGANADIRLIRLKKLDGNDPEMTTFCPIYENTDEVSKEFVIGGWGFGRSTELTTTNGVYGYQWGGTDTKALRWCTNKVDSSTIVTLPDYTSQGLKADFDANGVSGSTVYEGIPAGYDSGGGWFIFDAGQWKLAALNEALSHHGSESPYNSQAWFANPSDASSSYPDYMYAVRISSYADWINSIIANGYLQGDLNKDRMVDFADFAVFAQRWLNTGCKSSNNWCGGMDINKTSQVNYQDLAYIVDSWLMDTWL